MIDERRLSQEEKDASIAWILDNGMPERPSVVRETVTMVKAMGVKPFFGASESLLIGLLLAVVAGMNISVQSYANAHVMQLYLFLSAPLFYAVVQLYAWGKEWLCGMQEMVRVTKYGHGKMVTLRMAYASLISMALLMVEQMVVGMVQTSQYQAETDMARTLGFLACGLFIYCAAELFVKLALRSLWARLVVPAVWLVLGAVASAFSDVVARGLEQIPSMVLAVTALVALVIYVMELRWQLTMKYEEESRYAFN